MNYTMREFAEKYGLTPDQVKMACYRGDFDSHITKDVPIQKGGAKQYRIAEETVRTLNQVARLRKLDKAGKMYHGSIKLKNGLEVTRCALSYVMAGE